MGDLQVCLRGTNFIVSSPDGTPAIASASAMVQAVDVTCVSGSKSLKQSAEACTLPKSMVCRHWKNKGWCKYQTTCMFLHPEHRRGVAKKGGAKSNVDKSQSGH